MARPCDIDLPGHQRGFGDTYIPTTSGSDTSDCYGYQHHRTDVDDERAILGFDGNPQFPSYTPFSVDGSREFDALRAAPEAVAWSEGTDHQLWRGTLIWP